ncbi:MAG: MoaD/ThiS family protein [Anaerolineae bacterium]|nr:MoaD/ThiS family protein [Anaerolineae bacterium]
MKIEVRLLASLRVTAGRDVVTLDLPPGATLGAAVERLLAELPAMNEHTPMWHLAVNGAHAEAEAVLQPGDRITIFPYIAGG